MKENKRFREWLKAAHDYLEDEMSSEDEITPEDYKEIVTEAVNLLLPQEYKED